MNGTKDDTCNENRHKSLQILRAARAWTLVFKRRAPIFMFGSMGHALGPHIPRLRHTSDLKLKLSYVTVYMQYKIVTRL